MAALDPSEHSIPELKDELDGVDDPDALRALLDEETESGDRQGAKAAIADRLAEVEEDGASAGSDESSSGSESGGSDEGGNSLDILSVRERVESVTGDVIGYPLDGIVELANEDDGWRAVVDVVERSSVPDTQDILGQYELELDDSGDVTGYHRLRRYRRGDTGSQE